MPTKQASPVLRLKALESTGEIAGYASTFGGEPDSYGDVIAPGAFTDSLAAHKAKGTMPKLFWQHDPGHPIGKWLEAKEDETGLFVRGRLNMGVQLGREAYELLKNEDIDGLSIGYSVDKFSVDTETDVWTLEKVNLYEVSVVSIGANESATISSVKAWKSSQEIVERLKAGDRLTEREFEMMLKGALGFSNSQAERAARLCLKGQGEPDKAASEAQEFFRAMLAG